MKNPLMAIFGVLIIFFVVLFSIQYGVMAIGSSDDGVNMTGQQYESQYNAAKNSSITGVSLVQDMPMFLGLLILIIGIIGFGYYVKM